MIFYMKTKLRLCANELSHSSYVFQKPRIQSKRIIIFIDFVYIVS